MNKNLVRKAGCVSLPRRAYQIVVDFLASEPTAEQLSAFAPTPEMTSRLSTLLAREASGELTPAERTELDEYERIEHLIVMIKSGNLPFVANTLNSPPRLAERRRLGATLARP